MIGAALGLIGIQGLLMLADETVFHYRRELPRWERIGHPLDTLSVLIPIGLALHQPVSDWFWILAGFSTVFVTKDEWIHTRLCGGTEHWVHALLFALHPALFFSIAYLAKADPRALKAYFVTVGAFAVYQILYWNFYEARNQQRRL